MVALKKCIDADEIAKTLGAERKVPTTGGFLGALGLLADVQARFPPPDVSERHSPP